MNVLNLCWGISRASLDMGMLLPSLHPEVTLAVTPSASPVFSPAAALSSSGGQRQAAWPP